MKDLHQCGFDWEPLHLQLLKKKKNVCDSSKVSEGRGEMQRMFHLKPAYLPQGTNKSKINKRRKEMLSRSFAAFCHHGKETKKKGRQTEESSLTVRKNKRSRRSVKTSWQQEEKYYDTEQQVQHCLSVCLSASLSVYLPTCLHAC